MVDRINVLLKAKNITARQFAEEIGIQPSGISHILSGRNNPSLDFVMKVMKRWPEININWLMFGKGEMYVDRSDAGTSEAAEMPLRYETPQQQMDDYDLFSQPELPDPAPPLQKQQLAEMPAEEQQADSQQPSSAPHNPYSEPEAYSQYPAPHAVTPSTTASVNGRTRVDENDADGGERPAAHVQLAQPRKKIVKMVVLYDDHTFAEYLPE